MRTEQAPSGVGAPPSPLSSAPKPLLGRAAEVAALLGLLQADGPVLVNVTGARGVGKSALLHSVLSEVGDGFADIRRLDLTGETVATALAGVRRHIAHLPIPLRRGRDERLEGQLLLYLDRADVLAHAATDLARLVSGHPGVTIVIETVPPLRDPAVALLLVHPLPIEAAVELLRRSARAVGAPVGTDEASTAYLARICRAVDGNPLAVELAAARLPALPPPALAAALESPRRVLDLLTQPGSDGHGAPAIRGLLEHTYASASAAAQQLLDLLGVFAGSFSIDAVEAVSADLAGSCFDPLGELLDLRLVELDTSSGRYHLSRLVRDFASERLDAGHHGPAVRARHADHCAERARRAAMAADDADEDTARSLIEGDYPEALVALRWLQEADPARALRLAADLGWEAHRRGGGATVVEVLEQLTAAPAQGEDAARRDGLLWLVQLASWGPLVSDQTDLIANRLAEGMTLARAIGEPLPLLRALRTQFVAVTAHGDIETAIRACTEALGVAASIGHPRWLGRSEISLAAMQAVLRNYDEAVRLAVSGLARAVRSGDRGGIALGALALHALPAEHVRDRAITVPSLESVLEIFREQGNLRYEIHTLATLAQQAIDRADPTAAAGWVLARMERLGQGDLLHGLTISVMLTVHIARLRGDHSTAARLHGSVSSHMPPLLAIMSPVHVALYENGLATMRQALGQSRFDAEVTAGQLLDRGATLLTAVGYLREVLDGAGPQVEVPATTASPLPLTPREQDVLDLLARGLRNKEIAARLRITPKTVMHHTVAIYRKLGVRSRTEAVAAVARVGGPAGGKSTTELSITE